MGSGEALIRTSGDLVLNKQISTPNGGDIILSAEDGGTFHNTSGASAVAAGGGSHYAIFTHDATSSFLAKIIHGGAEISLNGLPVALLGTGGSPDDLASVSLNNGQTPVNALGGLRASIVSSDPRVAVTQSDEAAKFFLDLLSVTVFSGVDATARADNLPPERPPTIWTSTYHIYLQELEMKKKKKKKKTVAQLSVPAFSAPLSLVESPEYRNGGPAGLGGE
jgi:hypothetical protein